MRSICRYSRNLGHSIGRNYRQAALARPWPERLAERAANARNPHLADYYRAGCVAPEAAIADVPLVALDFETTGLDPARHGIVSIGLVPFTLRRIRCAGARHWIVRPRLPLLQKSITLHGITHSDIDQAPDLLEILDELLAALAGHLIVVHYQGIERPFFNGALKERLNEGIEFPVIDTMALEARLRPKRDWLGRMLGKPPVSIRLADSRTRYGLPYYAPHHALSDALATAELLQAQVQHHFSPDTPVSALWY